MWREQDEYGEIYRVDAMDEWMNAAYDDAGDVAVCDICGAEMRWSQGSCEWYCPDCGQAMGRAQYINHIGAEPPGSECITNCRENYPFCKKYCERYTIDPSDPMKEG